MSSLKYFFIFVLAFIVQSISYAQEGYTPFNIGALKIEPSNITAPYPSASDYNNYNFLSSLGSYGDAPVNFYTGTPSINIPLYEIKCRDYTMPISISYDASGIKVGQQASNVGLGWEINGIPSISRVIRGGDDFIASTGGTDNPDVYSLGLSVNGTECPDKINSCKSIFNGTDIGPYANNERDLQTDLFYFNLGDQSGTFILDASRATNRQPHLLLNELIKVNLIYTNNIQIPEIQIITANGAKYYFGEASGTSYSSSYYIQPSSTYTELTTINTTQTIVDESTVNTSNKVITKWLLRKIITPMGDIISCNYVSYFTSSEHQVSTSYVYNTLGDLQNAYPNKIAKIDQVIVNNGSRINEVNFPGGKVFFNHSTARTDIAGNSNTLDYLEVYDNSITPQKLIKKVKFDYSYFNDGLSSLSSLKYSRLKLLGVKEVDIISGAFKPSVSFTYNENLTLGTLSGVSLKLPSKYSLGIDHWGYFNNKNTGETELKPTKEKVNVNGSTVSFFGLDRDVDPIYTQVGVLTKITYPTGGFTEYTYENNAYNSPSSTSKSIGGLRISQIRTSDGDANTSNDTYKLFKYNITDSYGNLTANSSGVLMEDVMYTKVPSGNVSGWPVTRNSQSVFPVGTHSNGNVVGYSEVTVLDGQNGEFAKTIFKYHALPNFHFENYTGLFPSKDYYIYVYDNIEKMSPVYNSTPGNPANYMYSRNGLLKEMSIYGKVGSVYKLTKRIQNNYNNTNANSTSGFVFSSPYVNIIKNGIYKYDYSEICSSYPWFVYFRNNCDEIEISTYKTPALRLKLTETNEFFYDQSDETKFLSTKTTYEYDNLTHLQLKKVCQNPGEKGAICSEYTYPTEYYGCLTQSSSSPNVQAIRDMCSSNRNIYNTVIETIVKKDIAGDGNYKVIKASYNEFRWADPNNSNTPIVLNKTYNLETDVPLVETTNYATSSTPGYFIRSTSYCPSSHDYIYKDNDYSLNSPVTISLNDTKGNILESINEAGIAYSNIWGYAKSLPIAKVANAKKSQISYAGFESGLMIDDDDWNVNGGLLVDGTISSNKDIVYSGRYSVQLPKSTGSGVYGPTKNVTPFPQTGKYKLSCLVKTDANNSSYLVVYTMIENDWSFSVYPSISQAYISTTIPNTNGQWQYVEAIIDLDYIRQSQGISSSTNLSLRCFIANNDLNNVVYVDEFRVHPIDAEMTTYTYEPLVGVTSVTDINSKTTLTEYDGFKRVKLIRDQDKNILRRYNYVYKP